MAQLVTVEFPDHFYQTLRAVALQRQTTIEAVVAETVCKSLAALDWDYGEFTEDERRAVLQTAFEREDLWGSEEDKVWDTWTPSNPAT